MSFFDCLWDYFSLPALEIPSWSICGTSLLCHSWDFSPAPPLRYPSCPASAPPAMRSGREEALQHQEEDTQSRWSQNPNEPMDVVEEPLNTPSVLVLEEPVPTASVLVLEEPVPTASVLVLEEPVPTASVLVLEKPVPTASVLVLEEPVPAPSVLVLEEPVPTPSVLVLEEPVPTPSVLVLEEPVPTPSVLVLEEPVPTPSVLVQEEPVPTPSVLVQEEPVPTPSVLVQEEPVPTPSVFEQEEPVDISAGAQPDTAGELNSAWSNVQFISRQSSSTPSLSVDSGKYFLGMMRGPQSRLCWFKTTKTCYQQGERFPKCTVIEDCFTGIQRDFGRVTEVISCNRIETTTEVPLQDRVHTCKKVICTLLHVAADDQVDVATWEKENAFAPDGDSDSEEREEGFTPEEMEVPFISCHLSERGVADVGLKLPALRQAFSTLLASVHNQNFLFLVGKKILMRLAALNNQDERAVRQAYEELIQFLKKPAYQDSIKAELSGAQFHHYNLLDIFYELLLFGYLKNGSVPEMFEGGFLERLFALIHMWEVDVWELAGQQYFTVLIDHLTELCEVLFSQPLELYSNPAALATAVWGLLKQHVQLMMDTLEKL